MGLTDSTEAILAVIGDDGRVLGDLTGAAPVLPRMRFPGQHPPVNSELTDRVRAEMDLDTIILEQVDFATVVLQTQSSGTRRPPPKHDWITVARLGSQVEFLKSRHADAAPVAAWFRPDWFARADAYIDAQLADLGRKRTGRTAQVKHWSMSTVVRTPTDVGDVYLKCVLPQLAHEPRVTDHLGSLGFAPFTTILDTCAEEHWWLADDFGGTSGLDRGTEDRIACVRQLVQIQRKTVDSVTQLESLGCPVLDSKALGDRISEIIDRDDLWLAPDSWKNRNRSLSKEEVTRLRALRSRLLLDVESLASLELPPSLVHRDLHPDNAVVRADDILIHDWGFATITNPLFDLASWLHDATESEAAAYVDAYIDAWSADIDSTVLRQAWRLAKPLSAIVELDKFITLADAVGPSQDFNWLTMIYGWSRRLLNAADDVQQNIQGWRK